MDGLYVWLAELSAKGAVPEIFGYTFIVRAFLAGAILAPLLGGLSHLVVMRKMAFLSAALGHAALTGLTIGIAIGEPLDAAYGGIYGFCLLSALGMVFVRRRSALTPDTLIGVYLSLSLGLGICLLVAVTKRFNVHQIEAVMFGSLLTLTDRDLLLLLITAIVVGIVTHRIYNGLILDSLSPALARTAGVRSDVLEYVFVVLLTLAIVVSLKVIGALLVEALVVVPAAAARNLAKSTRSYLGLSVLFAFLACELGLFVSTRIEVPSGGAVVLTLGALFFVSLGIGALVRRR
jgi:zinc transport system permease protein